MGASETYGSGAQPRSAGYAYLVARALRARQFVDTGIPGTTLRDGFRLELVRAMTVRPRLVTMFFGFNDIRTGASPKTFVALLSKMSIVMKRQGAKVVIIGLPDLELLPAVRAMHFPLVRPLVASWNRSMAQVARRTGAHFLDLRKYSAELASHPEYVSADGLHPSNSGHAALARVILAFIRKNHLWSK